MEQISNFITPPSKLQASLQVDSRTTESTALAKEMYLHFGKKSGSKVYPLFTSPKYTHRQIKDAWVAFRKSGNSDWKYFCGILNKTR